MAVKLRFFWFFFHFIGLVFAQQVNTEKIKFIGGNPFGELFWYEKSTFSVIKTDAFFQETGRQQWAQDFKVIQSGNPLLFMVFIENNQEVILLDNYLNVKERLFLQPLGSYYNAIYAEDRNSIWLADASRSSITHWNRAFGEKVSLFPVNQLRGNILDLRIKDQEAFILYVDALYIHHLRSGTMKVLPISSGKFSKLEVFQNQMLVLNNEGILAIDLTQSIPNVKHVISMDNLGIDISGDEVIWLNKNGKIERQKLHL